MRWDLIEKFEVLKKGGYARARKSFSGKEDFFTDHYPSRPIVPEPLYVEMIAQAGGVLYGLGFDFKKEVILAKVADAEFLREMPPPCLFTIEASVEEEREEGAWIAGVVRSGTLEVARAKVLLVAISGLNENAGKKIVFSDHFLEKLDIYKIAKMSEALS